MDAPADDGKNVNRQKLFDLMTVFAVDTIIGMVSRVCKSPQFGYKYLLRDSYILIILPPLEEYFNFCAYKLSGAEDVDPFLEERFNSMTAIDVAAPGNRSSNRIDILQNIVLMVLDAFSKVPVAEIAHQQSDYVGLMMELRKRFFSEINMRKTSLSAGLTGCPCTHLHDPVKEGEKIFTFTTDKYITHEGKSVRMTGGKDLL